MFLNQAVWTHLMNKVVVSVLLSTELKPAFFFLDANFSVHSLHKKNYTYKSNYSDFVC